MPTLFRLLMTLAIIAALAYGSLWALATFVTPTQGEMTIRIPAEKVNPPRTDPASEPAEPAAQKPVAGD